MTSTLNGPDGNWFTGVSGTYYLPSTSDGSNMAIAATLPDGSREGPNAYIGMSSDGVEADAGVQFTPNGIPQGLNLPNRWGAYLRIYDGADNKDYQPVDSSNPFRVMGDDYSYIAADSLIGNDADLKFTIDRGDETCGLTVFVTDYGGFYYSQWYVAASKNIKPFTHSLEHIEMKREVSIDQNIYINESYIPFSNVIKKPITHQNGTHEGKTTIGYIVSDSYMNNIGWQNGMLYQGPSMFDWTSDLVSENYYSRVAGSSSPVSLTPPAGNPQNEMISIQHF